MNVKSSGCLLHLSFRGVYALDITILQDVHNTLNYIPAYHSLPPSHGNRRVNTAQLLAAPAELDCTSCKAVRNRITGRDPDEHAAIMATPSTIYTQWQRRDTAQRHKRHPALTFPTPAARPAESLPRLSPSQERPPFRHAQVRPAATRRGIHRGAVGGHDEGAERCNRRKVRRHTTRPSATTLNRQSTRRHPPRLTVPAPSPPTASRT